MDKRNFTKACASPDELVSFLKLRGLSFSNPEQAKHSLEVVSYYRLSGYFKPFYTSQQNHQFRTGTSFERIWGIYAFDRELRLLVSDALERIEIALRSAMSNRLSKKYGNLWYISKECFGKQWSEPNRKTFDSPCDYFKAEINRICRDQKEDFIKHYFSEYQDPAYPPSWMVMECLSFGKCTSLFRNLAKVSDKADISSVFRYHPRVIESCLEPLRHIRNICAHHARLWNRWFVFTPKHMKAFGDVETKQFTLHEQLIMLHKLNQNISPASQWRKRLYDLFVQYEEHVPYFFAGFQSDWKNDPFWQL